MPEETSPQIADVPWRFAASAQESERKRIARDLHDVLGQNVVAMLLGLNRIRSLVAGNEPALASIRELELIATEMSDRVHYLTLELRPSSLDELGLVPSIEAFVEHWTQRFAIAADFHSTVGEPLKLDKLVQSMVYRIAQEALTNVAKHSKATHVDVIIEMHEGEFVLLVEDNGVGFDIESVMSDLDPEKRLGILGMTERANMAGGFLKLDSEKSEGTTVILRIPKRTHE